MIGTIQKVMEELGIREYLIEEKRNETAELFFIRRKLDMRRIKDVTVWTVTVYRRFEKNGKPMIGNSVVLVSPGAGREEIRASLSGAYAAAGNVANPAYELYAGKREAPVPETSDLAGLSLSEIAAAMSEALFAGDVQTDAFLNSAELFVSRRTVRLVSSAGVDVGYRKTGCDGEFVVQCREPNDVEQHFTFSYETLAADALREKVENALRTVRDRAAASQSPAAGVYDLVLSGDHVGTLMEYYLDRAEASTVYAGYSKFRPGCDVQGETVTGEKLCVDVLPSAPYSPEGVPMSERELIGNGTLRFLHGNVRFCRYLDMEPTGSYRRVRLKNGTVPFDEMKKGCLYPVSFSDFQMDENSGYFGGEIRLAYLFTDGGVQILTGGSVSGSLIEKQTDLTFSTETYRSARYEGPFAVKLHGVRVAGK